MALEGTRILDFSQMMLGPWSTQILGDLGADIIKVERPGSGDWERGLASMGAYHHGVSPFFLAMNRNKRSLALDLKEPEAITQVLELARDADVVVENYRPGVMARLGLGYEDFAAVNPRIIYASGSGYGTHGPYTDRPGQDLLVQAISGLMSHTGTASTPPTSAGTAIFDASTALMLVIGVLAALRHRDRSNEGQRVDVSLLGTAIAVQCQELSAFTNLGQHWSRAESPGIAQPWISAPYGTYPTSDGHLAIAMAPIAAVATAFDAPELIEFGTGEDEVFDHREELASRIAARVATRTTAEWLDQLLVAGLWVAPVNSFDEVMDDPQVQALRLFADLDWQGELLRVVRTPIDFSGTPVSLRAAPPAVGEHNAEILTSGWHPRASAEETHG